MNVYLKCSELCFIIIPQHNVSVFFIYSTALQKIKIFYFHLNKIQKGTINKYNNIK